MNKTKTENAKPLNECTAAELAAHYRAQNLDRYAAWDKYIIDRAMRPEMNAKEFYRLFDAVTPAQLPAVSREVEFVPTHMDTLTNHLVMICGDGPWELVWDTGYHGRNPLCCPPEADRFVPIVEMQSEVLADYPDLDPAQRLARGEEVTLDEAATVTPERAEAAQAAPAEAVEGGPIDATTVEVAPAEVVPEAATGNIEAAKQYPIISEWLAGNTGQRISSYADRIVGADTRLSPARARDIAAGIVSEEYGLEADALSGYQATSGDDPIGKLYDAWTDRNEQQSFRADLVDMTGTRFAEDPETISRYTEIARGGDEIVHNLDAQRAEAAVEPEAPAAVTAEPEP